MNFGESNGLRRNARFTRFDILALGDTTGTLGGDLKYLRGMRFPNRTWWTGK